MRCARRRPQAVSGCPARIGWLNPCMSAVERKVNAGCAYALGEGTGGGISCIAGFNIYLVIGTSGEDERVVCIHGQARFVLFVLGERRCRTADVHSCVLPDDEGRRREEGYCKQKQSLHLRTRSPLLTSTDAYARGTVVFINSFSRVDGERSAPELKICATPNTSPTPLRRNLTPLTATHAKSRVWLSDLPLYVKTDRTCSGGKHAQVCHRTRNTQCGQSVG